MFKFTNGKIKNPHDVNYSDILLTHYLLLHIYNLQRERERKYSHRKTNRCFAFNGNIRFKAKRAQKSMFKIFSAFMYDVVVDVLWTQGQLKIYWIDFIQIDSKLVEHISCKEGGTPPYIDVRKAVQKKTCQISMCSYKVVVFL